MVKALEFSLFLSLTLLLSPCMKCDVDALLTILVETGIQLSRVDSLSTMGSKDGTHITKLLVLLSQGTWFLWQYFYSITGLYVSVAAYFCWCVPETKWSREERNNRVEALETSSFSCWVVCFLNFMKVLWTVLEYFSSNAGGSENLPEGNHCSLLLYRHLRYFLWS